MSTVKLNGQKFREVTLYVPWDLALKYEAACDKENVQRAVRDEPMLSLQQHLQATLIPALQVIVDQIPKDTQKMAGEYWA